MSDLESVYQSLVDGTASDGAPIHMSRTLQRRARDAAKEGGVAERLGALRVAAALGPKKGLPITQDLVKDPDHRVRRAAFNQAVAARWDGLPLLRDFAEDIDPKLAVEAIDLLVVAVDKQAASLGRRLLRAPSALVRRSAAIFVGHVGGASTRPELERLSREDPDDAVREAANEALQRVSGELPRGTPDTWWDEAEPEGPLPAPDPVGEGALEAAAPEPEAEPVAAAPEAPALPAVVEEPEEEPEPEPEQPWDGSAYAALPAKLPTEARALVRLLGMVAPSDRAAVFEALGPVADELGTLLFDYGRNTGDLALGSGLGHVAAHMGQPQWFSAVRSLASDDRPAVRAAGALAVGELGRVGAVPSLQRMCERGEPAAVRAAAAAALARLCVRMKRPDLARTHLQQLAAETDPVVQEAAKRALEALSG